jgi:ferredoxin-nitrate reductase
MTARACATVSSGWVKHVVQDRIANPWGARTPHPRSSSWPTRTDQHLADGVEAQDVERWVQSACVLCANGCGLDIAVKDGRIVGVRGRELDRINKGRLGPKGLYGWQANNSDDRLVRPLVRDGGELRESDWDTAMDRIVDRSKELLARHGPGALGFYNSGQLFLEDYYTLGVMAKAGLGTPHVDGNTRMCTATAAAALKETFSSDGQPGSYVDVEDCDTLFLVGHNVAETETVLWMRILDRLEGQHPPRLVVVDPRPTVPAGFADVHLAIRNGTNLALLNALLHELIANGWIDEEWIEERTVGFKDLEAVVAGYPPERVAELCGVSPVQIRLAARILGEAEALLSTVLQGVYQSNQATASACQVNNINLVRGMIGKPGAGVLQMNGQPTAQNTRETGADGDLPGFRNWQNERHIEELARLWNVDPLTIPHHGPPTHAMEIFRYAEEGSIRLLWIIGTNPAVSLPQLARIDSILKREGLFLVVQDCFLSETARLADVVLPAAMWGEKTGTFTNADRTVHLSEQAVEAPGEARPDMDIFRDYASRMGFEDRDGAPLIKWSTPEEAFEAWKACSEGRPCDYSGLSYDRLRGRSGIPWPCTPEAPEGTERLYTDGHFFTHPEYCEDFGHDLSTGAANDEVEYRALNPHGRAILKAADFRAPHEAPDEEYPFSLTSGRTVFHFHTRTKTGRTPELNSAAPDVWIELSPADASRVGIAEGDWVRVRSRRGRIEARARLTGIREGIVFAPFHYGYWDVDESAPDRRPRAANELTLTEWDPVSKQPLFKVAAVTLERIAADDKPPPAPSTAASPAKDA